MKVSKRCAAASAAAVAALCGCSSMNMQFSGTEKEISKRKMEDLRGAVEMYENKTHSYPTDLNQLVNGPQGFEGKWEALAKPKDIVDPWGSVYRIEVLPRDKAMLSGVDFQLRSIGPDKKEGTQDDIVFPLPPNLPDKYELIEGKETGK